MNLRIRPVLRPEHAMLIAALAPVASAQTSDWRQLIVAGPGPRSDMGMVYDAARGRMVMYGGRGPNGGPIGEQGDVWEWDGTTWTQVGVGMARMGHAMAFDRSRNRTVAYGGVDQTGHVPGLAAEWDGSTWHWSSAGGPGFRSGAAMCFDGSRTKVVLFGGNGYGGLLGDTWTYDGNTWQQLTGPGPSPRAGHALAFDEARGVVVLFGGSVSAGPLADTWELTGTGWRAVAPAVQPGRRHAHGMTYDERRGRVIVVGGMTTGGLALGDTWEFDGVNWAQIVTPTTLRPRAQLGLAFDALRGETIAFGGTDSGAFGDGATWSYHTVASYAVTGAGCSGTAAEPQLALVPGQGPRIGSVLAVEAAPLPGASFLSTMVFGFSDPQLPLCFLGRCDCTLLVAPDLVFPLAVNQGRAVWTVPIPLATHLIGQSFRNQVAVFDLVSAPRLDAMSGAGVGVIGTR